MLYEKKSVCRISLFIYFSLVPCCGEYAGFKLTEDNCVCIPFGEYFKDTDDEYDQDEFKIPLGLYKLLERDVCKLAEICNNYISNKDNTYNDKKIEEVIEYFNSTYNMEITKSNIGYFFECSSLLCSSITDELSELKTNLEKYDDYARELSRTEKVSDLEEFLKSEPKLFNKHDMDYYYPSIEIRKKICAYSDAHPGWINHYPIESELSDLFKQHDIYGDHARLLEKWFEGFEKPFDDIINIICGLAEIYNDCVLVDDGGIYLTPRVTYFDNPESKLLGTYMYCGDRYCESFKYYAKTRDFLNYYFPKAKFAKNLIKIPSTPYGVGKKEYAGFKLTENGLGLYIPMPNDYSEKVIIFPLAWYKILEKDICEVAKEWNKFKPKSLEDLDALLSNLHLFNEKTFKYNNGNIIELPSFASKLVGEDSFFNKAIYIRCEEDNQIEVDCFRYDIWAFGDPKKWFKEIEESCEELIEDYLYEQYDFLNGMDDEGPDFIFYEEEEYLLPRIDFLNYYFPKANFENLIEKFVY